MNDNPSLPRFLGKLGSQLPLLGLLLVSNSAVAALREVTAANAGWWNVVLPAIVAFFTLASAVLPLAAARQWSGGWRIAAGLPLLILLSLAVMEIMASGDSGLRLLEFFAWAMLNMIYMVVLFTIKRIFARADEEAAANGPD